MRFALCSFDTKNPCDSHQEVGYIGSIGARKTKKNQRQDEDTIGRNQRERDTHSEMIHFPFPKKNQKEPRNTVTHSSLSLEKKGGGSEANWRGWSLYISQKSKERLSSPPNLHQRFINTTHQPEALDQLVPDLQKKDLVENRVCRKRTLPKKGPCQKRT